MAGNVCVTCLIPAFCLCNETFHLYGCVTNVGGGFALCSKLVFCAVLPERAIHLPLQRPWSLCFDFADVPVLQAATAATEPLAGPSSRRDPFTMPVSQATPAAAVDPPPLAEPSVHRAEAAVEDIAEPFPARAARPSAAKNRIAAMERVLQAEAQARARGIEKEQERRQELHDLEVARLKRQMRHEQWKQTIERKAALS